MGNNEIKTVYGRPPEHETKKYWAEFYCAMCNRIPVYQTTYMNTGILESVEVGMLQPIRTKRLLAEGLTPEDMMICWGCANRIEGKMREIMMKRLKRRPGDNEGPEGLIGGLGGGMPV